MFRLFTDAENVRELLVHRCRPQHFESRKRRGYEVLFAELLKLGAPSTFVASGSVPRCYRGVAPLIPEAASNESGYEIRTAGSPLFQRTLAKSRHWDPCP